MTRDKVKEALKDLNPPASISTLIGKRNHPGPGGRLDFVQSETMMNQLGHLIWNYPSEGSRAGVRVHRIRKGDLKLPNPETEENV